MTDPLQPHRRRLLLRTVLMGVLALVALVAALNAVEGWWWWLAWLLVWGALVVWGAIDQRRTFGGRHGRR